MFGFGKKKSQTNSITRRSGMATHQIAVNPEWDVTSDAGMMALAAAVFASRGQQVEVVSAGDCLYHEESRFLIRPNLLEAVNLPGGGAVRASTLMQVKHPSLIPDGLHEYQHCMGDNAADGVANGIDQWVQMDWVTLLQSAMTKPSSCMHMEIDFEATPDKPAYKRRIVFGPVAHMITNQARARKKADEEHPFCPCCLTTQSLETFKEWIELDAYLGVRFFASRDADGNVEADCRVNGHVWEQGSLALRRYAATWPPAGLETRKQYVIFQTLPASEEKTS